VKRPIVEVPLLRSSNGRYDIDPDALERAFANGARAYLFCNPHNPVGRVFERDVVERIAELARTYDVLVIADEIHGPLTLPGAIHTPFLSLDAELTEKAVALTAASKAFNIAGLKCAALIAGSEALRKRLLDLPIEVPYRAGILGIIGSIAAFDDGMAWLTELLAYLDENRRYLADLLADELPPVRYVQPEASYLAWLDCSELALGENPSRTFLKKGRVALSRGRDFGKEGEQYVRLNMGTTREMLREIVRRMKDAIST
jgi:cystathionine beta-lyase